LSRGVFVNLVRVVAGFLALGLGISSAITKILASILRAGGVDVTSMDWLIFLARSGTLAHTEIP
jgi:hypothetical protein